MNDKQKSFKRLKFDRIDDVESGDSHLCFEGTPFDSIHYLRIDDRFEFRRGDGSLLISGVYPHDPPQDVSNGGPIRREGIGATTQWGEAKARRPRYGLRARDRAVVIEGLGDWVLTKRYFGWAELQHDGQAVARMRGLRLHVVDPTNEIIVAIALWCFVTDMASVTGSPVTRLLAIADLTYGGIG